MFRYKGKNLEEILEEASLDLNVETDEVYYHLVSESDDLVEADVYTMLDVEIFVKNYITQYINHLDLEGSVKTRINDEQIIVDIDCSNNSVIIGKAGQTLRSLVIITRSAVQMSFKKRFEVIIDVNNYKERRYDRVISLAKRVAKTVVDTKISASLDPMPNDERKMVHQALQAMPHIRTESVGTGKERHLTIKYDENKK